MSNQDWFQEANHARNLLDAIIDEALDCQDQLQRSAIHSLTDLRPVAKDPAAIS